MFRTFHDLILLDGEDAAGNTAVLDAPTGDPPKSEPDPEASPQETPTGDEGERSGGDAAPTQEQVQAALAALDLDEATVDAIIAALPEERRGNLRALQTAREEAAVQAQADAEAARTRDAEQGEAWDQTINLAMRNTGYLRGELERLKQDPDGDPLNPRNVAIVMTTIAEGAKAQAAKDHSQIAERFQERFADQLGDLSDTERKIVREARAKDAKAGTVEERIFALAGILASRAAAPKPNGHDKQADVKLDKLAVIAEALGKGAPKLRGKAPDPAGPLTAEQAATMPIEQLREIRRRERRGA